MKLIKTSDDHATALGRLEELMVTDPAPNSLEEEELELLAFLIDHYEKRAIDIPAPSPAEAIRFRMEQAGLKQQDLVPFIGSKSRVSEVLSGKRDLTLAMVRKLHDGLGIPLESLVQEADCELPPRIDPDSYPVKEMFSRGYFPPRFGDTWSKAKDRSEEMLQAFFCGRQDQPIGALNRQTTRKKSKVDMSALHAWRCRVLDRATEKPRPEFDPVGLNKALISQLKTLSTFDDGSVLAQKKLGTTGIAVVIEEHLPKTHLDGAALWHPGGFPVIGLTLRYDRLDNFWFTLFHELGHLVQHLDITKRQGFIDTDIDGPSENDRSGQGQRTLRARSMTTDSIVSKDWSFCHTLRDDGVGYGDYLGLNLAFGGRPTVASTLDWKLIIGGRGTAADQVGLYDLDADVGEKTNLASKYPDRVKAMQNALQAWSDDVTANATPQPDVAAFQARKGGSGRRP